MRSVFNTLIIVALCSFPALHAQIGINVPANESPQAQLDIRQGEDNLPGMLIPRVSSLPVAPTGETIEEGLMVFLQGENPNFYVYVDGGWQTIASSAGLDTTPPTAPGSLTASNPTSTKIDLAWVASTDNVSVEGYYIYDNSDDSLVATVTGSTSTTISGLNSNTSYTFYATAYDAAGNESDRSNTDTATTTLPDTINEGYFETGWDGWVDGGNKADRLRNSNLACEQQWSVEIKHNKDDSNIELRNVDLTDYTDVTVDFQYKTSNWNSSNDYFTFKLNGVELGRFYESQTCASVSITINSSDYSFGNADDFKFEGEMSGGNEIVYIDAVVIKGYD